MDVPCHLQVPWKPNNRTATKKKKFCSALCTETGRQCTNKIVAYSPFKSSFIRQSWLPLAVGLIDVVGCCGFCIMHANIMKSKLRSMAHMLPLVLFNQTVVTMLGENKNMMSCTVNDGKVCREGTIRVDLSEVKDALKQVWMNVNQNRSS